MEKTQPRTFFSGNIAVISEYGSHWTTYYFSLCGIDYFLVHTLEAPYWELMMFNQETHVYIPVVSGVRAVREWLTHHTMPGII